LADRRRLEGRRALVTGAGSDGIGRAIASAFAREGAHVAAHFHGTPLDDAERERMRGDGPEITQLPADIADPAQARSMVRDAASRLGGLDILVANAGITERTPFLEITDEAFDRLIAVNLHGTFACCQEAARIMVGQQRGGRVIVVSSVNHDNVVPLQSHYCASKGAIRQLSRAMALELAPHGIAVNLIAPAATMTDMVRETHRRDPDWSARVTAKYPMGRIGHPDDFRGPAVFLASDECSFMTGATLVVDGGFTLSR
jgi:NAD(P)-dependent dehydrogenase (short-subunit alcohol dehydrogenase family)